MCKQATEVSRRQARVKEAQTHEHVAKLHAAEAKMQELRANMAVLGKEAGAALAAVEAQQQRLTFQRLVTMVCAHDSFIGHKSSFQVEALRVFDFQLFLLSILC